MMRFYDNHLQLLQEFIQMGILPDGVQDEYENFLNYKLCSKWIKFNASSSKMYKIKSVEVFEQIYIVLEENSSFVRLTSCELQ